MKGYTQSKAHETMAKSLRDFGYPDVTAAMIKDVHTAMRAGKSGGDLPHGVVGRFAASQLREVWDVLEKLPA